MMKRNVALGVFCIFALTACGAQQEDVASTPRVTSNSAESPAGVTSSEFEHTAWYQELIEDGSYSLEDALEEHPEKRSEFDGEIIFDELRTGEMSEHFDIPLAAGQTIKLTMICDSPSSWEATLDPLHKDFFAGGNSCSALMSFETKPLEEDLPEWDIDIRPQDDNASYRVIVEIGNG